MLRRSLPVLCVIAIALTASSARGDDDAIVDFAGPVSVRENAGTATIGIKRTGNLSLSGSVFFQVFGDSQVDSVAGIWEFGPNETFRNITVPIHDDSIWKGIHLFRVVLGGASAGVKLVNANEWGAKDMWCYIMEDDPFPKLTVESVAMPEGSSGSRAGAFIVRIDQPVYVEGIFTIKDGTAIRGTDYSAGNGTFQFDAAHTEVTIPFVIFGDTLHERNETLYLQLAPNFGAPFVVPPDASCTILNDEGSLTPDLARLPKGQPMKFALDIGLPASAPLDIPLRLGNPSIVSAPASVHFNAGQSTAMFSVTGRDAGSTRLSLSLPAERGGGTLSSRITVVIEKPAEPAITAIEPSSGNSAGGTPFVARGSLLTADCRLRFGDTPATPLSLTSDGMLTGLTPPHAAGSVDVMLDCGESQFILTGAFTFIGVPRVRSARH
jgi:hypothetical protein